MFKQVEIKHIRDEKPVRECTVMHNCGNIAEFVVRGSLLWTACPEHVPAALRDALVEVVFKA